MLAAKIAIISMIIDNIQQGWSKRFFERKPSGCRLRPIRQISMPGTVKRRKKPDIARPYADTIHQEVKRLPKDSQMDDKKKRWEKSNGQTPIGKENQNQNRNAKKHSVKNNDV